MTVTEVDYDVVVVGAGFAGLYTLHALREAGFTARVFDAAPEIGGTWYWNRYPGCRCDIESIQYSFQFSDELQQDWTWSEKYASQPELLAYINHVADRFKLRPGISLETRVESARFDEQLNQWVVATSPAAGGPANTIRAQHVVLGVGCLSTVEMPAFDGLDQFTGEVFHTARWPQHEVDLTGKRVGVIGTGSSGIQAIPLIAQVADHLHVFQRTANYVVPARNRPFADEEVVSIKANYDELRARAWATFSAYEFERNPGSVFDMEEPERREQFEKFWQMGGLPFLGAFGDLLTNWDANAAVTEFWKTKVYEVVHDATVADLLIPKGDVFGGKRLCAGNDYLATFNRSNVTLVDVSQKGIERFTPSGLLVGDQTIELDVVVCATGFDAMTGSVVRMDIVGPDGERIAERWADGPHNYLGLAVAGFPNLWNIAGPGSPSVFATMVTGIEHQADWIVEALTAMRANDQHRIDVEPEAEAAWGVRVAEVAKPSLRSQCDSWYIGSNVAGKARVFMPWIGGFPAYVAECKRVATAGYEGFVFQ